MNKELASAIGAAIFGVLVAYFVCNMFIGPIDDVSYKTVTSTVNAEVAEPSPEVFNYKAINPTVEVYVGECTADDQSGQCTNQESN